MILLIFGITLLLGLSLALPFFFSFKTAVGSSVVSKTLDYTMFHELIHSHSWNLESLLSQGRYMVLIFWLVMIFFVGGIVRTFLPAIRQAAESHRVTLGTLLPDPMQGLVQYHSAHTD